jgi:hypothetical protein
MIYPLNEQAAGPITFDQAVDLMLPGDKFQLTFQKKVSKYGFTVFKPGKVYDGSRVLPDGRIRVVHEDITFKGKTSTFTKEDFLEELKSEGEPCSLLDCNKSLFIRPGAGYKTFADALQNPSFDAPKSPEAPVQDPASADPAGTPKPAQGGGISFYVKSSADKLEIKKTQEGQYIISYGDIINQPIEPELRRLFGYDSWDEYKHDNFEDLTKKAPTVHPFHVAYALEDFLLSLKPLDYDLVAVPVNGQGVTAYERTLVQVIHGLRMGFFGSGLSGVATLAGTGILNIAMHNPIEGLKNPGIIDRIKDTINTEEKIAKVFSAARFAKHPNGAYWRRDLQAPFITYKRGEALITRPDETVRVPAVMLYEIKGRAYKTHINNALNQTTSRASIVEAAEPESNNIILEYYILPVGWQKGIILTKAEETLAKKIGANYSSGLMVTPSGGMTLLNLKAPIKKKAPVSAPSISSTGTNMLFFGHSQTGAYKRTIKGILPKGVNISKTYAFGVNDHGLAKKIKQVPKKNWTHAFLCLGGNVTVSDYNKKIEGKATLMNESPDYKQAKEEIINYVINDLGVPRENIVVILPPINDDPTSGDKHIEKRKLLHTRTIDFFNSIGINIAPVAVGGAANFRIEKNKEGEVLTRRYHVRSNSEITKKVSHGVLSALPKAAAAAAPPAAERAPVDSSGRTKEIVKGKVDPLLIYNYLMTKPDMTRNHAIGMVNNLRHEGGFKPGSKGDHVDMTDPNTSWQEGYVLKRRVDGKRVWTWGHPNKSGGRGPKKVKGKKVPGDPIPKENWNNIVATSGGLWAWHNAGKGFETGRFSSMKRYAGSDWRTDWKSQVDFCLTEGLTKKYLSIKFSTPEEASKWFTYFWEAPMNRGRLLDRDCRKNYREGCITGGKAGSRLSTIDQYKRLGSGLSENKLTGYLLELINEVEYELAYKQI